jgi:hypothetical protein
VPAFSLQLNLLLRQSLAAAVAPLEHARLALKVLRWLLVQGMSVRVLNRFLLFLRLFAFGERPFLKLILGRQNFHANEHAVTFMGELVAWHTQLFQLRCSMDEESANDLFCESLSKTLFCAVKIVCSGWAGL